MRLLLKAWIYILLLTVLSCSLYSQSYEWISDSFPNSLIRDVFEINGDCYAILSSTGINDEELLHKLSLLKFNFSPTPNSSFFIEEEKILTYNDGYTTHAAKYVDETGVLIVVQSKYLSDFERRYKVTLFDANYSVLNETHADITGRPIIFQIDGDESDTYILASIGGPPSNELFYLKYSHSKPNYLPPIIVQQSQPNPILFLTSMKLDEVNGSMLLFHANGISILDSNLLSISEYDYSEILTNSHGHLFRKGDWFFSHGISPTPNSGIRKLVLHKYDSTFLITKADTFGWPEQDNYPFVEKSIDCREHEIIVGGHLDGPFNSSNFINHVKKFYLAKYNKSLDLKWYKEFGGDKPYVMLGLHILESGGVLAYGYVSDTTENTIKGYIIHVNNDGSIITSEFYPHAFQSSIILENPGHTFIQINNVEDDDEVNFSLFNIDGSEILSEEVDFGISSIDVSYLSAGSYPYLFIKNNLILRSGVWIKSD